MEAIVIAGLSSTALIVLAVWIHYESRQQLAFSQQQVQLARLRSFRLSKMLKYLGINAEKYIEKMPPQSQWMHMNNCKHCPNTVECDDHLSDGKPILDMSFCPNYISLIKHSTRDMRREDHRFG
jgi:hypothetical protein